MIKLAELVVRELVITVDDVACQGLFELLDVNIYCFKYATIVLLINAPGCRFACKHSFLQ